MSHRCKQEQVLWKFQLFLQHKLSYNRLNSQFDNSAFSIFMQLEIFNKSDMILYSNNFLYYTDYWKIAQYKLALWIYRNLNVHLCIVLQLKFPFKVLNQAAANAPNPKGFSACVITLSEKLFLPQPQAPLPNKNCENLPPIRHLKGWSSRDAFSMRIID